MMAQLNSEGIGIQSMGRILNISASSVIRHIKLLSSKTIKPIRTENNEVYEVDEIQTFIGKNIPSNSIWTTYAINRRTKTIIDFVIGRRTKENLQHLTDKVLGLDPKYIYTDDLNIYRSLIHKDIHKVQRFKINHIERKNLTLRTHLKRLNRRTICFSKSIAMLHACLMIYFFC